jgi:hypothetical protein
MPRASQCSTPNYGVPKYNAIAPAVQNHKQTLQYVLLAVLAGAVYLGQPNQASAAWPVKVITEIPLDDDATATAHAASKNASLQVDVGDPLEITGFKADTQYTVNGKKDGKVVSMKLPFSYSRLGVLSYGMHVQPSDQARLPAVSKGEILDHIASNYISIQVRVQRDSDTGATYLHYQPFAAVGTYGSPSTTAEFQPLMEDSVRDVRGLGLFVKKGTKPSAEAFRTFVASSKSTFVAEGSNPDDPEPATRLKYELIFVRARIDGNDVQLHTFTTGEFRTRLIYLQPYAPPTDADQCSVKSTIFFSEYTAAKQSPSAKVARHNDVNSVANFTMDQLNDYAAAEGWQGDAMANLTDVLDAVIDGDITPTQ